MLHRHALSLASVAPAPVAYVNRWLADAPPSGAVLAAAWESRVSDQMAYRPNTPKSSTGANACTQSAAHESEGTAHEGQPWAS